jgi:hypothetical protein
MILMIGPRAVHGDGHVSLAALDRDVDRAGSPNGTTWLGAARPLSAQAAVRFLVALPRAGLVTLRQTFVRRCHRPTMCTSCCTPTVPRRAVKPNAASRRAEGAGLTAKARTERSSMSPQCGSSSDTVREIKYQILQLNILMAEPRL